MTSKIDIACELLEQALRLYFDGNADFATLHLAGGAEELLGKHLEALGRETSFASLRDSAVRITKLLNDDGKPSPARDIANLINRPKNSTKHMDGTHDAVVSFDARLQARDMLDRAVTNFYHLLEFHELEETALIRRFNAELASR